MTLTAGLDIGGTGIKVVVIDDTGQCIVRRTTASPAREGGDRIAGAAIALLRDALDGPEVGGHALVRLGAGTAGVTDQRSGTILAASDSFTGWAGYPLGETLERELDVPCTVLNDVHAFVWGERANGAARGLTDLAAIALGTGVGGALVLDGHMRVGPGSAAGEIGHTPGYGDERCTCGGYGHLESKASGRRIAARYVRRSGHEDVLDAREVARRARHGDGHAAEVFVEAGRALGQAVVSTSTLLDISDFLFGGGLINAWDLLQPAIENEIDANPPVAGQQVRLRTAELGTWAGAHGAAAAADGNVKNHTTGSVLPC